MRQIGVRFERRLPEDQRAELEPIDDAAAAKRAIRDAGATP
jgi:hypothetical protein